MNIVQGLGALATLLLLRNSGGTLAWKTVEQWLHDYARPENNGQGFAGEALPRGPSNAYVELRKEPGNGGVRVTAHAYINPQHGAFATKTWEARQLDAQLEKRFGHHQRIRIDI